jgi:Domain of unknown function (DUF4258)
VSETFGKIRELVRQRKVRVSDHGNEETREDDMDPELLVQGIENGILVEDYPDAFKGPTVLLLQDYLGKPVHVVWGLARAQQNIATLITAYFPDPQKWYDNFMERRPK